jgi:hypothetical protein
MTAADRSFQAEARRLEVFALIALVIVIIGICVRLLLPPVFEALRAGHVDTLDFWATTWPAWIPALPSMVLTGAIDESRKLFGRLARGELFSEAVGRGVKGIGTALLFAAVTMAVIVPWLQAWVDGKFGFGEVRLDTLTWVLGVVGAALLMVGRLLKRADAMQDELERFV